MSAAHMYLHIMFCLFGVCFGLFLVEFVRDEEIILYIKFPERWLTGITCICVLFEILVK